MAGDENNMSVANTDGNYRRPGKFEEKINHAKNCQVLRIIQAYNTSVVLHMKY